jgi:hypothetical protein
MNTQNQVESGESIQKLLRGEISAIETYDQVIEKFKGKPQEATLTAIRQEHSETKKRLKALASKHGEKPEMSSGVWGSWAKFTTGAAKIFGEAAALKALKEGEEHGLKEYQAATEEQGIDLVLKSEIEAKFITNQQKHIASLDQMIAQ